MVYLLVRTKFVMTMEKTNFSVPEAIYNSNGNYGSQFSTKHTQVGSNIP